ncbi:MAG: phenylalanine--tRNA ligase subunit beta [Chloroflexi bacterium]|nr:phenylalanine--tRNA ligase subunit beta [Chloroflexota bacterium]
MKVPVSWLKEFVDIPASVTVEELSERLTIAGLEVAKIHYIGIPQSAERHGIPPSDHLVWDRERVLLGAIKEIKPHPDADRLVLAVVDYGGAALETVVTGAPNLFPYKDQGPLEPPLLTPFALEGAELIDGHGDGVQRLILEERELRGIPNRCMVCSEMELGISEEHEGIMLLPYEQYGNIQPGTPLVDVLGDAVIEMELTPNLARCFSVLGVAREVAALYDLPIKEPDYSLPPPSGTGVDELAAIEIREPELNPRFTAGLLRDVTITDSPWWLQWRLKLVGQRPINNIVDVSNYVMFEIGQPTHAFDYDILANRAGDANPVIITRLPDAGEELTTLDGKVHKLDPSVLLVADEKGALSLAGVMGGLESEVQEPDPERDYPGSTTVLLEAAAWNFITIRKTMSSTKLHSEAAARFSRGVHPAMALRGLKRGLKLMVEVSGATLAPGLLDAYPAEPEPVVVDFPVDEVNRLLGFDIPKSAVADILRRLQFGIGESSNGEVLQVTVPDHRLDISPGIIGRADLVEEIARVYGYDRIPNTIMGDSLPPQRTNVSLEMEERVRDLLAQAGLREVINYRFSTPQHEALLTPEGQKPSWPEREYIRLANPISAERTAMRQTLLAGLLDNAVTNMHHHPRQRFFEIGHVYYGNADDLPEEIRRLGILLAGPRQAAGWMGGVVAGNSDFYDLKGIVETLLAGLHIEMRHVHFAPIAHNSFHPGRVATLLIGDEPVGLLGEVHPLVREAFGLGLDLEKPVLAAELDLDRVLTMVPAEYVVQSIPTQPPAYRDIAVVVSADRRSASVEALIWGSGGELLREVRLFDVYQGDPIPEGQKSLAYALTFQSETETLTDKAVNKLQKKIIKTLEDSGAKLRA